MSRGSGSGSESRSWSGSGVVGHLHHGRLEEPRKVDVGLVVAVSFAVARRCAGARAALGQLARGGPALVHLALFALLPLPLLLLLDFVLGAVGSVVVVVSETETVCGMKGVCVA